MELNWFSSLARVVNREKVLVLQTRSDFAQQIKFIKTHELNFRKTFENQISINFGELRSSFEFGIETE